MKRGAVDPYLDTFLIIDPADHPHTHLSNLIEGWLLETDVSEDLDHPFSYADTSVLHIKNNSIYIDTAMFCNHLIKKRLSFSYPNDTYAWGAIEIVLPIGGSMRL